MLHRELLGVMDRIRGSPFGPNAKNLAAEACLAPAIADAGGGNLAPDTFLLMWRCVAAARGEAGAAGSHTGGEFVATLPTGLPKGARPTNIVISEMLTAARSRVVIVGYAFTAASGVVDLLIAAAIRGVELTIVCDRNEGGCEQIQKAWPSFLPQPRILMNSRTDDTMAKMHSKLLIVDDSDTLITSANFTYHGLHGNIEFGVRLRDPQSGLAASEFVTHLMDTRAVVPA